VKPITTGHSTQMFAAPASVQPRSKTIHWLHVSITCCSYGIVKFSKQKCR